MIFLICILVYINRTFCKQTVETLIRVCTVCLCHIKKDARFLWVNILDNCSSLEGTLSPTPNIDNSSGDCPFSGSANKKSSN